MGDWKLALAFMVPSCLLMAVVAVADAFCGGCIGLGGCP